MMEINSWISVVPSSNVPSHHVLSSHVPSSRVPSNRIWPSNAGGLEGGLEGELEGGRVGMKPRRSGDLEVRRYGGRGGVWRSERRVSTEGERSGGVANSGDVASSESGRSADLPL